MDKVYTNIKQGYRGIPLAHLAHSDQTSLFLILAYIPLRKTVLNRQLKLSQMEPHSSCRTASVGPTGTLEEFGDSILCYIKNCIDTVTVDKHIQVISNHNPWMTRQVQMVLKERNTAFRSGDEAVYSTACANLKRGIKEAKSDYKRKIEEHLDSNNGRKV